MKFAEDDRMNRKPIKDNIRNKESQQIKAQEHHYESNKYSRYKDTNKTK